MNLLRKKRSVPDFMSKDGLKFTMLVVFLGVAIILTGISNANRSSSKSGKSVNVNDLTSDVGSTKQDEDTVAPQGADTATTPPSASAVSPSTQTASNYTTDSYNAEMSQKRRQWATDATALSVKIGKITDLLAINQNDNQQLRGYKIAQAETLESQATSEALALKFPQGNPSANENALKIAAAQTAIDARAKAFSAILSAKNENNSSNWQVISPELKQEIDRSVQLNSLFKQQIGQIQSIL